MVVNRVCNAVWRYFLIVTSCVSSSSILLYDVTNNLWRHRLDCYVICFVFSCCMTSLYEMASCMWRHERLTICNVTNNEVWRLYFYGYIICFVSSSPTWQYGEASWRGSSSFSSTREYSPLFHSGSRWWGRPTMCSVAPSSGWASCFFPPPSCCETFYGKCELKSNWGKLLRIITIDLKITLMIFKLYWTDYRL